MDGKSGKPAKSAAERDLAQWCDVEALRDRDGNAALVAMWNHIENVKAFLTASTTLAEEPARKPKPSAPGLTA